MTDASVPLPLLVRVSQAFAGRLPSQRVQDLVAQLEPEEGFGDLMQRQPFRIVAFRALVQQFPDRDPASLWLHAYDVECEVEEANPTNGNSLTRGLPSAPTTGFTPTIST